MAYLGTQPNDVKKNTGLYTPSEILELTKDGSWGGSLELIAEQSYSTTVTAIDFTSIKENVYDVHFLTVENFKSVSNNNAPVGIQLYESGVLETGTVYQYALLRSSTQPTTQEDISTSSNIMKTCTTATGGGVGKPYNFYCYLYNLGNSGKYSFQSSQGFGTDAFAGAGTVMNTHFGGATLPQASLVDGIRVTTGIAVDLASFDIKLYGVKQI